MKKIILILSLTTFLIGCHTEKRAPLNPEQESILYFAYGSNISSKRLNERIELQEVIGAGQLHHYELKFNSVGNDGSGKCNIVAKEQAIVWGVLYKISSSALPALDAFEGVPQYYEQKTVLVIDSDGTTHEALTYVAVKTAPHPPLPYLWYRDHVYRGAVEHHLPPTYIAKYILSVEAQDDPDEGRAYTERLTYEF